MDVFNQIFFFIMMAVGAALCIKKSLCSECPIACISAAEQGDSGHQLMESSEISFISEL